MKVILLKLFSNFDQNKIVSSEFWIYYYILQKYSTKSICIAYQFDVKKSSKINQDISGHSDCPPAVSVNYSENQTKLHSHKNVTFARGARSQWNHSEVISHRDSGSSAGVIVQKRRGSNQINPGEKNGGKKCNSPCPVL